jgi:hypothetical protein
MKESVKGKGDVQVNLYIDHWKVGAMAKVK